MSDQAKVLRGLMQRRRSATLATAESHSGPGAHIIAITSGKGGVGKSNVALNLAVALARLEKSVCLMDANLGLGNIDLLCGANGYWNLSHVISGARDLSDVIIHGPEGIDIIPGASGLIDVADCSQVAHDDIFRQLEHLERNHDYVIIDTPTGIHRQVRQFVAPADVVLIVTTPEPTSVADAYAGIKALSASDVGQLELVVNQADTPEQAQLIFDRLKQTAQTFLRVQVSSAGSIPYDRRVCEAVARRVPFVVDNPGSPASLAIGKIAWRIRTMTGTRPPRGLFLPKLRDRMAARAA